jgi:VCBS repeat-containing protein
VCIHSFLPASVNAIMRSSFSAESRIRISPERKIVLLCAYLIAWHLSGNTGSNQRLLASGRGPHHMTADESEAIASQLSRARRTDEKNHIASCLGQPATKVTTHRTGADDKAVVGGTKLPTTRRL